jgi:hypothetical protein
MATGKKRTTPRARGAVVKPNPGPETLPLPETGRATGERHYRSEGQRLLAGLDLSRADLARVLGASDSMVGFLKAGTKNPGPEIQRRAEKLGIPRAAWGRQAKTGTDASSDSAPVPARPPDGVPSEPDVAPSLEVCERVIRFACSVMDAYQSGEVTLEQANNAAKTMATYNAQRAKILGDSRSDEEKLAASPRWLAIKALLARVLLQYPQAARSVSDALKDEGLG